MKPEKKGKPNFPTKAIKNKRRPKSKLRSEGRSYESNSVYDGKFPQAGIKGGINDVSWYAKNQQMLRDAASLSYNMPIGLRIPKMFSAPTLGGGVIPDPYPDIPVLQHNAASDIIPSVCAIEYIITPGKTDTMDAANYASQNIYSFVRYMNSGAKNYTHSDLLMYLLAMDSIYAAWNYAKRIYGYCALYSQYNRDIPRLIAQADAIDLNSVVDDLANFRLELNALAAQITSFCVPNTMPIFLRHSWMASNIYKDSDNNKAQLYLFTPVYFYELSETVSSQGTTLIPVLTKYKQDGSNPWSAVKMRTARSLIDGIRGMINAVLGSEDVGIMSGDILKAYGQGNLIKIEPILPDYVVEPVYNETVLNQIHNSTMLPLDSSNFWDGQTRMYISQNVSANKLTFLDGRNYQLETTVAHFQQDNVMINMPWNEVTPENTMEATRLITMYDVGINNPHGNWASPFPTYVANNILCGTEIIVRRRILWSDPDPTATTIWNILNMSNTLCLIVPLSETLTPDQISVMVNTNKTVAQVIAMTSNFDWHPLLPIFEWCFRLTDSGIAADIYPAGRLGDVSNYTVINRTVVQGMHETAIMSEYNVPQLGAF